MKKKNIVRFCAALLMAALLAALTFTAGCGLGGTKYSDEPTVIDRFEYRWASDMAPVTFTAERSGDGSVTVSFLYDGSGRTETQTVSTAIADDLAAWVDKYDVRRWDGFEKRREGVRDGYGYAMHITLGTGETITASGYAAYPDNFEDAYGELYGIIDKAKKHDYE